MWLIQFSGYHILVGFYRIKLFENKEKLPFKDIELQWLCPGYLRGTCELCSLRQKTHTHTQKTKFIVYIKEN